MTETGCADDVCSYKVCSKRKEKMMIMCFPLTFDLFFSKLQCKILNAISISMMLGNQRWNIEDCASL